MKEHKPHDEEYVKAVSNRLKKAKGQLQVVINWLEGNRDCADVLTQLSAVVGALNGAGRAIIRQHMEECITHAVENGDEDYIKDFGKVLEKFLYK